MVRSDNGPHYVGQAYKEFAQEYGFCHITSSPHYPRSNGFIESQVKAVKAALLKAKMSRTDPNIALLCLRATPIDSHLPSPADVLFRRPLQDNLPKKFQRNIVDESITDRLQQRQETQKLYHDNCSKKLPSLTPGQKVVIQSAKTAKWEPATVVGKAEGVPRSYNVSTPTGSELRRNRSHIRPIPQESKGVRFNLQSGAAAAPLREARRESSAIAYATPSPSRSPDLETSSTPSDTMISSELANTTTDGGTTSSQHVTRSGRHIKAPARLDL